MITCTLKGFVTSRTQAETQLLMSLCLGLRRVIEYCGFNQSGEYLPLTGIAAYISPMGRLSNDRTRSCIDPKRPLWCDTKLDRSRRVPAAGRAKPDIKAGVSSPRKTEPGIVKRVIRTSFKDHGTGDIRIHRFFLAWLHNKKGQIIMRAPPSVKSGYSTYRISSV